MTQVRACMRMCVQVCELEGTKRRRVRRGHTGRGHTGRHTGRPHGAGVPRAGSGSGTRIPGRGPTRPRHLLPYQHNAAPTPPPNLPNPPTSLTSPSLRTCAPPTATPPPSCSRTPAATWSRCEEGAAWGVACQGMVDSGWRAVDTENGMGYRPKLNHTGGSEWWVCVGTRGGLARNRARRMGGRVQDYRDGSQGQVSAMPGMHPSASEHRARVDAYAFL